VIAAEDERSRTNDLLITTVEDLEERTEQMNVTYLSDYVRREQPRQDEVGTQNLGPFRADVLLRVFGSGAGFNL
jgi:hypothetical protein